MFTKSLMIVFITDLLVEAGEVELVLNVVLVDLAEEFVATEAAEPRNPAHFF